ncbi:MAG: S-adenosylmethionine:diacylglycerol 3-amino-3-carboxypropyl transferase [Candidatus Eremiobacteraeota bacterium]|nr:S-adenosylmethionine:diacylglycerol 3-amino-3-carboxypropyl transferase [Candidatus Eremiobacteraeota bacterium]
MTTLRYAQCWEDADVLVDALAVRPGGTYVAIASAGDNALAMLAAGPARVIALDREPAQLAALALRVAAYRTLAHQELLALVGSRAHDDRLALYARCRAVLDEDARTYWDARQDAVRAGIGSAGRFERYLALFRTVVLPLIHSRGTVRELLDCDDAERARFYDERWDTLRWRLTFRAFFARPTMSALGRDPRFFAHADGPVSQRLLGRIARSLRDGDAGANPYVRWILTGGHGDVLPLALRPESFDAIRANLDRLDVRRCSLEEFVDTYAGDPVDGWNLSDVFEYMDDAAYASLLARIAANSAPRARLAYWNMLVPRRRPDALASFLAEREDVAAPLRARDRVPFYGDFVVEEAR